MALIDRPSVLTSAAHYYIEEFQTLPDTEISNLLDIVIDVDMTEDVDTRTKEAQCRLLHKIADVNIATALTFIKREKFGRTAEDEYDTREASQYWTRYKSNLDTGICPAFGYTPEQKSVYFSGLKVNPGKKPDPMELCHATSPIKRTL